MSTNRLDKVNSQIKRFVSEIISQKLKDPRIVSFVTVLRTETTADLKHCKVYLSVFDKDKNAAQQTFNAINSAAGFIRNELSRDLSTHSTPQLHFVYDVSMEHSDKINSILSTLGSGDKVKGEQ